MFNEVLNKYIEEIGCTTKELSKESGISQAVLSRYKNGSRTPKYQSTKLEDLIKALTKLSNGNIAEKDIRKSLENNLIKNNIDFEIFRSNLNYLIDNLNINVAELSRYIGYDSSYLSKIKSGFRKPLNTEEFAQAVCKYIVNHHRNKVSSLIDSNNDDSLNDILYGWLSNNKTIKEEYNINDFLTKLDEFDLNDYIKSIKFDKLKVPTMPVTLPKNKTYYGLDGFKKAQIDVLKQIILSKATDDVFFYSNMEMISASKDLEFTKKFMIGLVFILKKGLKLNIIHNLDRPFKEIMLGLEGWIPLYMTGQINPYYLKNNSNFIFSQIKCVSGNVSLSGECLTDNIDTAKIIVTNNKDEVMHNKEIAKTLLKRANPLMKIYNNTNQKDFNNILKNNIKINGKRKNILNSLPVYTISYELLDTLLNKNKIPKEIKAKIIKQVVEAKERIKNVLENNIICDEINILTKEEFNDQDYFLDISKYSYEKLNIKYSYEDYLKHIELTKKYKKENPNYKCLLNKYNAFKNININIIENNQAIITKTNTPIIHFVIHHPKLVNVIYNFEIQIKEK